MSGAVARLTRAGRTLLALGLAVGLGACQTTDESAPVSASGRTSGRPTKDARLPDASQAGLIGRDSAQVEGLLGAPQLLRRDAPAEVWQYRATRCILDLYLYPENGVLRVAYVEARNDAADAVPAQDCLANVLDARGAPIGS